MELIYSNQRDGFDPDKRYRNPEHFDKPEAGVSRVLVIGDWPNVVTAYEATDAEVSVEHLAPVLKVNEGHQLDQQEQIGRLQAESDMVRSLIVGLEAGEI